MPFFVWQAPSSHIAFSLRTRSYKGGALVATVEPTNVVKYATADHLGTPRVWTNSSGAVVTGGRHDYAPFGEELFAGVGVRTTGAGWPAAIQADGERNQFTSYERDVESELDYAKARYYSNQRGGFNSPDSYNIIFEMEKGRNEQEQRQFFLNYTAQPQIWNKYSYTLNNPLKYDDPDGRRPLTLNDLIRLNRLGNERDKATEAGDSDLANALANAISEIKAAIDAVPEGQNDPVSLQVTFYAIDQLGNNVFGPQGNLGGDYLIDLGPGTVKCNIFCAMAYANSVGYDGEHGIPTTLSISGSYRDGAIKHNPLGSGDYSNPQKKLAHFDVTDSPIAGDVVSFADPPGHGTGGHSGIYIGGSGGSGGGAMINASTRLGTIAVATIARGREGHINTVFRRYKP